MVAEKKDTETKLTYDDRRKELTQVKTQVIENKTEVKFNEDTGIKTEPELISTVNQEMKAVYTEAGIRLAHKNLTEERTFLEKRVSQFKKQIEKSSELSNDLKELKEKLIKLQKFDAVEKAKAENEGVRERLKEVKTELDQINNTIGTRLKF